MRKGGWTHFETIDVSYFLFMNNWRGPSPHMGGSVRCSTHYERWMNQLWDDLCFLFCPMSQKILRKKALKTEEAPHHTWVAGCVRCSAHYEERWLNPAFGDDWWFLFPLLPQNIYRFCSLHKTDFLSQNCVWQIERAVKLWPNCDQNCPSFWLFLVRKPFVWQRELAGWRWREYCHCVCVAGTVAPLPQLSWHNWSVCTHSIANWWTLVHTGPHSIAQLDATATVCVWPAPLPQLTLDTIGLHTPNSIAKFWRSHSWLDSTVSQLIIKVAVNTLASTFKNIMPMDTISGIASQLRSSVHQCRKIQS